MSWKHLGKVNIFLNCFLNRFIVTNYIQINYIALAYIMVMIINIQFKLILLLMLLIIKFLTNLLVSMLKRDFFLVLLSISIHKMAKISSCIWLSGKLREWEFLTKQFSSFCKHCSRMVAVQINNCDNFSPTFNSHSQLTTMFRGQIANLLFRLTTQETLGRIIALCVQGA